MKIFLDNNIIIDALGEREEFKSNALTLLEKVALNPDLEAFVASKAIAEVHYTLKKIIGESRARSALGSLLCIVDIIDTTKDDFIYALSSDIPDFEDAVTFSSALRAKTNYIITRDKHYANRSIPAVSAEEFLKMYFTTFSPKSPCTDVEKETHIFNI